jgi:hypothetical protein
MADRAHATRGWETWNDVVDPPSAAKSKSGRKPERVGIETLWRRFGVSYAALAELIEIGFLEAKKTPRSRQIVLPDHDVSLLSLYIEFAEKAVPLVTTADFRRFDRIRTLTGGGALPVPDYWFDDYTAQPMRYNADSSKAEVRAVLKMTEREIPRVSREIDLRLQRADGETGYVKQRWLRAEVPLDHRKALIDALSPDVPPLTYTWLDPKTGRNAPEIPVQAAARLLSMRPGRARDVAIVHCAVSAANSEVVALADQALGHVRGEDLFAGIDTVADPRAVEVQALRYLAREVRPHDLPWARVNALNHHMAGSNSLIDYADEPISEKLRAWLKTNAPARLDSREFKRAFHLNLLSLAQMGDVRRKARTDPIALKFDDHLAEAEANLAEATLLHTKAMAGHAAAGSNEEYAFSFEMPIRGERRRDTGATMLVNAVSITAGRLLQRLLAKALAKVPSLYHTSFVRMYSPGGGSFDPALSTRRLLVYVDCVAVDPNGPTAAAPYMVECFATGATLPPGMLSDALLDERRAFLSQRGLRPPFMRPSGLIGGVDPFETELMLRALVEFGQVVIPTRSFLHGVAIGHLHNRIGMMTTARGGESAQLIDDWKRGWGETSDKPAHPTMKAIEKGRTTQSEFVLDRRVPAMTRNVITLTLGSDAERVGAQPRHRRTAQPEGSKRMPIVAPARGLPKSLAPDRYVFQAHGHALTTNALNYCTSFLFMRLSLSHDPRHGAAGRRRKDGATKLEVAEDLGHRSPQVSAKYSRIASEDGSERTTRAAALVSIREAIETLGGRDVRRGRKTR